MNFLVFHEGTKAHGHRGGLGGTQEGGGEVWKRHQMGSGRNLALRKMSEQPKHLFN